MIEKRCLQCKTKFESPVANRKYCSRECFYYRSKMMHRAKEEPIVNNNNKAWELYFMGGLLTIFIVIVVIGIVKLFN